MSFEIKHLKYSSWEKKIDGFIKIKTFLCEKHLREWNGKPHVKKDYQNTLIKNYERTQHSRIRKRMNPFEN